MSNATIIGWPQVLRRYLIISAGFHLTWEFAQLPLYTIWATGTRNENLFAFVHCTAGDVAIAGLSLLGSLVALALPAWPALSLRRVYLVTIVTGVAYTIYSEWLNTTVRQNWAYSEWMPVLPATGTGLSPLMQWIVADAGALACRRSSAMGRIASRPSRRRKTMSQLKLFLGSPAGLIVCLAAAALGVSLLLFHLAYVALALPYLALLACPLMHLMHRGHHRRHRGRTTEG
jgi:hypothetical protein